MDAQYAAGFSRIVNGGESMAGFLSAEEQPLFLACRGVVDGVFVKMLRSAERRRLARGQAGMCWRTKTIWQSGGMVAFTVAQQHCDGIALSFRFQMRP